jgi:hypothetical protein
LGHLGISNNYSLNGITLTAYGFIKLPTNNLPTNLYSNNIISDKNGLGLAIDVDHEINKSTFIQLDLSGIISKLVDGSVPNITIKDIQKHEGFSLYGSNELGSQGVLLYSSKDSPNIQNVPIPYIKDYRFISITASGELDAANIILHSIDYIIYREYLYNPTN